MKNDKLVFLFLSFSNLVFVYGFLLLIGIVSEMGFLTPKELITISLFTSSMQLAQAVSHQSVVSGNNLGRNGLISIVSILVLAAFIIKLLSVYFNNNELEEIVFPILLGIICSIRFGFLSGRVLIVSGAKPFQVTLFFRNLTIYPVFFLIVLFELRFEYWYIIVFIVNTSDFINKFVVYKKNKCRRELDKSNEKVQIRVVLLGLLASSIYRNDINIARQLVVDSESFISWHYFLICFSLLGAFLGFVVTNIIYPNKLVFIGYFVKNESVIKKAGALFFMMVLFFILYSSDYVSLFFPIIFLLIFNTMLSAKLHIQARSKLVYIGAVVSFILFLVVPFYFFNVDRSDLNVSRFFAFYLCSIGLGYKLSYLLSESKKFEVTN